MSKKYRLSQVDHILKELRKSRKEMIRLANALPDEDAYATPYSVVVDGINQLDQLIDELKPSIKDAEEYRKQNPNQSINRARRWCFIYKNSKDTKES